jgi:hypothetical protein
MLQLLSNLVGHDVKKAPVFFRETPWFGVEQGDRADREFVHPQRHACIKANASSLQQRVVGETFVAGDIFHDEKLVARNGVRANRERARGITRLGDLFRQPDLRPKPFALAVDKRDKRHWAFENAHQSCGHAVENGSFGVSSTCRVKHDLRHYQSFPDPFRTNTRFRAFQSENLVVVPEAERQRLIERRDKALAALASKGGETA